MVFKHDAKYGSDLHDIKTARAQTQKTLECGVKMKK